MEKSLEQRARNLYVISGVIIVYLLAGADLNNLTLLGFRVPAKYPIVFSIASVLALLWFGWRYRLIWKKQKIGKAFRDNHLRALHQTLPFRFLVKTSLPHATILASHFGYDVNDPNVTESEYMSYDPPALHERGYKSRSSIAIKTLTYFRGGQNIEIGIKSFPDKAYLLIDVPWKLHFRYSPPLYWSKAWNEEEFAAQRLPVVAFFLAILLILCKSFGGDPAGVWGLIPYTW